MIMLILIFKIIGWSYFFASFSNHSQLLIVHLEPLTIYNNYLKFHRASDHVGVDYILV